MVRLPNMRPRALPLVTLILVALNILVFRAENGFGLIDAYGLVPAGFSPSALLTNLFLHDPRGLSHIGGNMVFLAVFGAVVEGALGHTAFLALYLAAGVAGGLLHVQIDPSSTIPLVGASGAISGVLAVAAVLRPRLLGFASVFLGANIWHSLTASNVAESYGAHIGGFAAGLVVVLVLRAVDSEALEAA